MPQGTIKKLVADRGFGFIKGEQGELFFHRSEVQGVAFEELREGQKVEYQVGLRLLQYPVDRSLVG